MVARSCAECNSWLDRSYFSRTQWTKGVGLSRCANCVDGGGGGGGGGGYYHRYQCGECFREFANQNELNQHMQVHRPRTVACPICHETRFRSGANAVQHVESGYCTGCLGQDNARQQIYQFASAQIGMRPYMSSVPQLTYGGSSHGAAPEYPYSCNECNKQFRQLSQLMQHQDAKHNNTRLLGYN